MSASATEVAEPTESATYRNFQSKIENRVLFTRDADGLCFLGELGALCGWSVFPLASLVFLQSAYGAVVFSLATPGRAAPGCVVAGGASGIDGISGWLAMSDGTAGNGLVGELGDAGDCHRGRRRSCSG